MPQWRLRSLSVDLNRPVDRWHNSELLRFMRSVRLIADRHDSCFAHGARDNSTVNHNYDSLVSYSLGDFAFYLIDKRAALGC